MDRDNLVLIGAGILLSAALGSARGESGPDDGNGGENGNGDEDPGAGPIRAEPFSAGYADRLFTGAFRQGDSDQSVSAHGRDDALQVALPEGDHYGIAASYRPAVDGDLAATPTEMWTEYEVYFDQGFDILAGGMKLPGPADRSDGVGWGSRIPGEDGDGWSARGRAFSTGGGTVDIGYYTYHYGMGQYGSNYTAGTVPIGEWVTVRQRARVNDLGESNGVLEMWLDGEKGIERTNMKFRETDSIGADEFYFNVYHGGDDPSPRSQNVYFDNLRVWASDPAW